MRRNLTVTTPASSLQLLTIAEMRAAAGVTDAAQDDDLNAMGLRIAATIATECRVAIGAGGEPTLLRETLTEVIRQVNVDYLFLSRRHNVSITSIVVDGDTLTADDYEVDAESAKLTFLIDDVPVKWRANKVTVVYAAGFSTVPADLKLAAMDFFRLAWQEKSRDPSLKSQEIDVPGVERVKNEYWVGVMPGGTEGAVPSVVDGQLQRFRVYGL